MIELIEAGADIHVASGNGFTPLMEAIEVGSLELVEFLLERGVFLNFAGRGGISPLHIAVDLVVSGEQINLNMIQLLLSKGANVNQKNSSEESPIDWAIKSGIPALTELLSAHAS